MARILAGVAVSTIPGKAAGADVTGAWSLNTQCPIANIQITSNGGTGQKQLDLNSYATISGTVVQAADGSLSMPQDGTFTGRVNGTDITFSKYTSWWEPTPYYVSYTVGVSYSGTINGTTINGSASIYYDESGSGGRLYWHGFGMTTGPFRAVLAPAVPVIVDSPLTQTAESGSTVEFRASAAGTPPLGCQWYLNSTQLISTGSDFALRLRNVQFSQAGQYKAVVTNNIGAVTSSPAMLQVIAPTARAPVPGLQLWGEPGGGLKGRVLNIEYADSLAPAPNWQPLDSVMLTNLPTSYFDRTPCTHRFYRAWQVAPADPIPSLEVRLFPAILLVGNVGDSWRVDYINQFGPIDAWIILDTVTLTNSAQRYVDVSAPGAPSRLYRVVKLP